MTNAELNLKAKMIFNSPKVQDAMANLAARWADEKDYEDINDYRLPLQNLVCAVGAKITKMNRRPFGFYFQIEQAEYLMKLSLSGTLSIKRIR